MLHTPSVKRGLVSSLLLGPILVLAALLAPGLAAAAGPISSGACSTVGTTVTCDLWAKTGTLSLPGATTSIWGFASSAGGAPTVPGPVIIANAGDTVVVNLTNSLASATTAILFQGQPMAPDLDGVAPGGTTTYTFTAGDPGTYLYEAGLLPGTQYQVAKGLYGALIVRPAGGLLQANDDPSTAFDDEALVIMGEVDTTLNASANPAAFDLRGYAPRYFLVNGKAYPQTASITTTGGNRLLLRYLDAGLQHHSMAVLGLRQTIVGEDGSALANPRRVVAESIAPGQGMDALVAVPGSTAPSTNYPLYDAALAFNNTTGTGSNAGIGGMLLLIDALPGSAPGGDTVGPLTSSVAIDATTGSLTASVSDAATGGNAVAAAEYFVDTLGPVGTGTPMSGTFPGDPVAVSATVAVGSLPSGSHTVYVRGQDGLGNWGVPASATFGTDTAGPLTSAVVATPSVTNTVPGVTVALQATADDRTTGNTAIAGAEYFIDAVGATGTGSALTPSTTSAPVASLTATIGNATLAALSVGPHTISIHARDALGNWGPVATVTLTIDRTGPTATAVSAAPNPNNGATPINSSNQSVRVLATLTDASPATIRTGEVFIDTVGATGSGIPMLPVDGVFDGVSEAAYADIPLTTIAQLSQGSHTIHVRGKDSAGNWGPTAATVLVIDKIGPTTSGVTLTPPAANAQAVTVSANASDVASGNSAITGGEFFIDTVGPDGSGTAMSAAAATPSTTITGTIPAATVAALSAGNHTVFVHARDAAGNWGARVSVTLLIDRTPPTFSSITLSPSSILTGTASVTLTVNGASDGASGSGVAGGEYWFGTTNIAAGTGTAFTGLTTSIPTGSLTAGTYTVRVRIRDAAQNWSTGNNGVRTATLTVVNETIFADAFTSTTLPGAWTSRSTTTATRLSVTTGAALEGTYGLRAQGNNTNYVQYNFGGSTNPTAAIFDAKFLFRPNANASTGMDIFMAASNTNYNSGNQVLRVRYRLNAGTPQVQIQVGSTNTNATWSNLLGGTSSNTIEVVREAVGSGGPNPGSLRLYVNGTLVQTLSTTSTASVTTFRLGAVTSGGSSIDLHLDAFTSKRTATPYGP